MTKKVQYTLQFGALIGAVLGMEWYFFRSPSAVRPAQAAPPVKPAVAAGAPGARTVAVQQESPAPERRLKNLKQLTFGGENAEAYWSFDGKQVILQSTRGDLKADQIFVMNADGTNPRMVSTGKGRTTCAYFLKDGRILYASTHLGGDQPPPLPDRSQGYVWPVYPTYDIFTAKADGTDLRRFTDREGYDAEATVSPDGRKVVFTSMRDGDLDLYVSDIDGRNARRVTNDLGYDGGAFFSPDGKMICWRANHPQTDEEKKTYRDLLAKDLVRPSQMELWVMNADGTGKRQVTKNGAANFCPFFTPDGKKLIFSSNLQEPRGRNFDLYLINLDGTGLERVTTDPTFDGFPMFSPDGKKLIFASNRNAKERGETNVFVAEWAP